MKIIILAGGSGTRLWPISRETFPKQFLKLGETHSFLQKTVLRFLSVFKIEDLFITTNCEHLHLIKSQLAEILPFPENQIVIEPTRKNTGPAIAFAVRTLEERGALNPEECFLVTPSDAFFSPESAFLSTMGAAEKLAREGNIVTFGIRPHSPETGYGYIHVNDGKVQSFVEKPDLERAQSYLLAGNYLWNSGIFVFQDQVFWEEIEKYAPSLADTKEFGALPSISIDKAIMEKSDRIAVIPLDLKWSDVGSWDSIFDLSKKDHNHNVKIGNVHDIDTKNSLIIGGKRLISTIGLEDVVIIETEDAVFLGKKGESQRVKELVEELKKQGKKETQEHVTIKRPWGEYTVLEEGPRYKVKRIQVHPLERLSLQLHYHRSEHWVVVKGTAKVTVGESEQILHENESTYVPKGAVHRLENPGKVPLELIEVQVGEYVGEDDIVRLEDIYGRVAATPLQKA